MVLSEREEAVFEGGIKLGGIYHQFIGTPVSRRSRASLEAAIEEAVKNQPFVEDARVKIDERFFDRIGNEFDYLSLTGKMLDVRVTVRVGGTRCVCRMEYREEMDYPLMYVEEIESLGENRE
ncbi:MAG: dihydroneopterin aldolase [Euryarchaeota archaeon]|nr:dihydroneopterin aldolase [Euryarchaeota archaeon]